MDVIISGSKSFHYSSLYPLPHTLPAFSTHHVSLNGLPQAYNFNCKIVTNFPPLDSYKHADLFAVLSYL